MVNDYKMLNMSTNINLVRSSMYMCEISTAKNENHFYSKPKRAEESEKEKPFSFYDARKVSHMVYGCMCV